MYDPEKITYFAETDYRNKKTRFGIKAKDRNQHVYTIGKTGTGKSTMLENMAVQDIQDGNGLAFVDPHGKSAELLLSYVPEERIKDVLYFAPFDLEYPISFNVMEDVGYDKRHLVANGLMSAFKKIWVDAWSARMEYILNNILLALLEYPESSLLGVNRMLADKAYRKKVVNNVTDVSVKSFWEDEFAKYGERYMQEAGAAIQNKIGQFISNPLVRNIVGQPHSSFDVRKIMDEKKILIVNLSKGRVGEANANLIGSMLITKIYLAAMSRADASESMIRRLPNFYLYVDEFQSFANESFADILSEARKYKLNLTIAHQYIEQMQEDVRNAVFGNVGTMISFRVGANDAESLEKEFAPEFTAEDIVNLEFAQIYLRLMINGMSSRPFSAKTIPPITKPSVSFKKEIIESSQNLFAKPRGEVEKYIIDWHKGDEESTNQQNNKTTKQQTNQNYKKPAHSYTNTKKPYQPRQTQAHTSTQNQNSPRPQTQTQYKPQPQTQTQVQPRTQSQPRPQSQYNPHPQSNQERRPSPEIKKSFQTPSNEMELRKAISLDYLKRKREDEIQKQEILNKKKEKSNKNVSELKEALGDILKEARRPASTRETESTRGGQEIETKKVEQKPTPIPNKKENEIPKEILEGVLEVKDIKK